MLFQMSANTIEESTVARKLIPPSELATIVSALPDKSRAIKVVLGQVDLAKEFKRKSWRREFARELDKLQFHSRSWISQNIHELPVAKKPGLSSEPCGVSKDIRLQSDPSLQVVRADCSAKANRSPYSEALLEGVDMEVDQETVDEAHLQSPHRPRSDSKPVSPVKPMLKEASPQKSWAERMESEDPPMPSSEEATIPVVPQLVPFTG